jgi:hypothetical protein
VEGIALTGGAGGSGGGSALGDAAPVTASAAGAADVRAYKAGAYTRSG